MKTGHLTIGFLGALLIAGPISAEQRGDSVATTVDRYATKENIGRAIGTAAGAFVGSQFADGGTAVFTAALGGLAGYLIGGHIGRELSRKDQAGLADATQTALNTGRNQDWKNPETGVTARVAVQDDGYVGRQLIGRVAELPALELINDYYVTGSNTNVRGGPGTEYAILHRVAKNQRLPVIGRVVGESWYMVAERGSGSGFIYAPLMSRASAQPLSQNAIRDAQIIDEPVRGYAVEQRACRVIDQEVQLPGGDTKTHSFRACQQKDGSWLEV